MTIALPPPRFQKTSAALSSEERSIDSNIFRSSGESGGTSQQQVIGDEQLDDRRDGDAPAVAVGHPLPRRAVQHDGGDVGALCGGFGRGLLGATVKAVEGRGGLVGRGLGQGGQRALRGDDGQLRRIGVHRRRVP